MSWVVYVAVGFAAGAIGVLLVSFIFCPIAGELQIDSSHEEKDYYRLVWTVDPESIKAYKLIFLRIRKRNDLVPDRESH